MNHMNHTMADPTTHVRKIRQMLVDVAEAARAEMGNIDEPKAQAMLETSAEVLQGLAHAFEDYERGIEVVWKR
jgi:hypothetical protein